MSEGNIRIGLIGLGTVCEMVHYPGFSRIPGVEIAGLCEVDEDLLARRQAQWNIAAGFTDVDRFLADVNPDAVTVAVPNAYHHGIVLKAVRAGCHVLCEKPIGMTVAETVDMYEAARGAGVRHMTAFTYRFVPGMRYLKHLVDEGRLGEIRHARFQRLQDWGEHSVGWRQYRRMAATGELGDMGIHRIDFAENLLGPIKSVCASLKQLVPRDRTEDGRPCEPQDVEDWAAWIAEFESGTTGVFEMGKLTKGHGPGRRPRHLRVERQQRVRSLPAPHPFFHIVGSTPGEIQATQRPPALPYPARFATRSEGRRSGPDFPLRPGLGIHMRHPRGAGLRPHLLPRDARTGRGRGHPRSGGLPALGGRPGRAGTLESWRFRFLALFTISLTSRVHRFQEGRIVHRRPES